MGSSVTLSVPTGLPRVSRYLLTVLLLDVLCVHAQGCSDDGRTPEPDSSNTSQPAGDQTKSATSLPDPRRVGRCETILVLRGATTRETLKPLFVSVVLPPGGLRANNAAAVYFLESERYDRPAELERALLATKRQGVAPDKTVVIVQPSSPVRWRHIIGAVAAARKAGFTHVALPDPDMASGMMEVATAPGSTMRPDLARAKCPDNAVFISAEGRDSEFIERGRATGAWIVDGLRTQAIRGSGIREAEQQITRRITELRDAGQTAIHARLAFHPEMRCDEVMWMMAVCKTLDGPLLKAEFPDGPFGISRRHRISFHGTDLGKGVKHIVFVSDRNGTMITVFDYVRLQMQLAISDLTEDQNFHIVMFGNVKPIEGPKEDLLPATAENKIAAVEFLESDEMRPRGRTIALPAIKRAFEVLKSAGDKRGKVVVLLTDGLFFGVGRGSRYKGKDGDEAVLNWLKDNNAKGDVTMYTFLYGKSKRATELMKAIAAGHGGKFKAIDPNE